MGRLGLVHVRVQQHIDVSHTAELSQERDGIGSVEMIRPVVRPDHDGSAGELGSGRRPQHKVGNHRMWRSTPPRVDVIRDAHFKIVRIGIFMDGDDNVRIGLALGRFGRIANITNMKAVPHGPGVGRVINDLDPSFVRPRQPQRPAERRRPRHGRRRRDRLRLHLALAAAHVVAVADAVVHLERHNDLLERGRHLRGSRFQPGRHRQRVGRFTPATERPRVRPALRF